MSQDQTGDKTEAATPQKLRKAREQGQVARSKDLATAVGLVVCLQAIVLLAPGYLADFRRLFALGFVVADGDGALDNLFSHAFVPVMLLLAKMLLPLFIIPLCVLIASLFPGGWVLSAQNLMPKLERLNPLGYFQRITKPKHLADFATTALKAFTLFGVLYWVMSGSLGGFLRLSALPLGEALPQAFSLAQAAVFSLVAVFVLYALIDVPVQRLVYLREQRMSKRDIKEEHKTTEGRPEVKQRIRQIQQQIARRGVRKTVPTADVVIVNPEHYAVAIKYDTHKADAPYVVAKGLDEMALYIRRIAEEAGVEVLRVPPLARAVYHTSQVRQQIPAALYQAVAVVLRHVLALKAFRQGQRRSEPHLPHDLDVPAHLSGDGPT
ncbi:flagellar type III secretion system protein FlhB [Hydrogenophaga sp. PML113]|uniref:flagellar type III secretion system protein FlhB n=1 Tax=Hydrogenophaga sp. PML113 TaxID=1899350 RepID=UPI0008783E4D|nr:flagellar type III secretion system protein FlhB [Hydrogenophaga sp. PML113]